MAGWPTGGELLLFVAAVALLNATPGVDLLLTVTRTLQGGARAGLAAALGINAGCAVHALAAASGLAALLELAPAAYRLIELAGAVYLAWLGVSLLRAATRRRPPAQPASPLQGNATSFWRDFRGGLLTNLLNPKVALFFLAFLPPFVGAAADDRGLVLLALGAWFIVQSTVFLLLVVALVARVKQQLAPRAASVGPQLLQALAGALFLGLAWRMAAGGLAAR